MQGYKFFSPFQVLRLYAESEIEEGGLEKIGINIGEVDQSEVEESDPFEAYE